MVGVNKKICIHDSFHFDLILDEELNNEMGMSVQKSPIFIYKNLWPHKIYLYKKR